MGTIGSLIAGSMMPVFAFTMAKMMSAFEIAQFDSLAEQKDVAEMWLLVLVFAGVGSFAVIALQASAFTIMGARLTLRIR